MVRRGVAVDERLALPAHVAADDAAGQLDHPEQRLGRDALAGARLADEAERLALADREADVADGVHGAPAGDEVDLQVVDLEQAGVIAPPSCFSRERRSPRRPTTTDPAA